MHPAEWPAKGITPGYFQIFMYKNGHFWYAAFFRCQRLQLVFFLGSSTREQNVAKPR
jgi:hypothetical protein